MRHVPFFRWVLAHGLVLIGGSLGLYTATPDSSELLRIDLIVVEEEPDGRCAVRWESLFDRDRLEAPYPCHA
ncbi:hypothetical protein [Streptomyces sp. DH37]|uniref:hypothetical protein n=1 Tax=Streptomyces sp. DH37 TaxID=3040122 RepID=UPI0024420145|nr:hypothetical protein [Streptomyces sp. DH37]MDG9703503.1 hypothetical protein [Streptomyces sp. DH37]